MTQDHTMGAHTLTKCIGEGVFRKPTYQKGHYRKNEGFFLCSDGYRNQMSEKFMMDAVREISLEKREETEIRRCLEEMGRRNMEKGERDNMSAVYVRLA